MTLSNRHSDGGPAKRPEVEVWLFQPVSQLKGHSWPVHTDGRPLELATIQEPCFLTVHFPSGKTFRTPAKLVTMNQDHGVVEEVSPLPLMEPADFKAAVDSVGRVINALDVNPHDPCREKLHEWRAHGPGDSWTTYTTGTELEQGVGLFLEIKALPGQHRWYLVLNFEKSTRTP